MIKRLTLAGALWIAPALHSQAVAESSTDPRCDRAEETIVLGADLAATDSALRQLDECGGDRLGRALALGVLRLKTSGDDAQLDRLWRESQRLLDGRIVQAALEIAGDREASDAARLHALRSLLQVGSRRRDVMTAGLASGSPLRAAPLESCVFIRRGYDYPHAGAPVPPDANRRIRDTASRVLRQPNAPPALHSAARCVLDNVNA